MKILNPFQMNDWDIKNIYKFIIIIQLLMWITAALNDIGIHIPIISETVTFISLIFINGVLILRIFKIHGLGNIETLLYAIGLSIASAMFLGMIIDILYPVLGCPRSVTSDKSVTPDHQPPHFGGPAGYRQRRPPAANWAACTG